MESTRKQPAFKFDFGGSHPKSSSDAADTGGKGTRPLENEVGGHEIKAGEGGAQDGDEVEAFEGGGVGGGVHRGDFVV